jgi:hypothetical protein
MKFGQYVKEMGETAFAPTIAPDPTAPIPGGMDNALPVDGSHVDVGSEGAEEGGDVYEGFKNIQTIVHILAELDQMEEKNDIMVKLNTSLEAVGEDLESLLASIEKDEGEEQTDQGESEEAEEPVAEVE